MSEQNLQDDYKPIKKANLQTEFTTENVADLLRCRTDPIYFMEKFMYVQHPKHGKLPFKLYPYQRNLIKHFHDNRFSLATISRQAGKTQCAAGYLLWYAMFHSDKTILVASKGQSHAIEIMDRIRYAYEECPNWLKAGCSYYNKHSITFDNGSRIISQATTENTGRGYSISLLYCLGGENTVTVRDKRTGEIKKISLKELHDEL